ncbi:MAG TPA: CpaF family protein [Anaerolineales bacterium]|nr:CpaF family protein [Anaerolineales bacterium]
MSQMVPAEPGSPQAAYLSLKNEFIHILQRSLADNRPASSQYAQEVMKRIQMVYAQMQLNLPDPARHRLMREVYDELTGYGPIQPLLNNPEISEIMVVGAKKVYIERHGELTETPIVFEDDAHVIRVIERILSPLGRRVDADAPAVDARLPDGSRVHVIIPPVAVDGPCLTIRKFLPNRMEISDLVELGAMTENMGEFLKACVAARLNIIISGGTSSGKTTMLNILSSFIPAHERIITIEDAVELQLKQKHLVRLETKNANVDGTGEMSTRMLVRNALRMRPDRIVVGEVRSGEAMDMLQAMNTGHTGSMTTIHANTPRDAISRLETTCMMAGLDMPLLPIRKQIASAFNLIVHQTRLEDGTRKTTQITEVVGMEGDVVTLTDIFKFEKTGISPDGKIMGELKPTGIRPIFSPRLEVVGYKLSGNVFGAATSAWSEARIQARRNKT